MATRLIDGDHCHVRIWTVQGAQAAVNTFSVNISSSTALGITDQELCDHYDTVFAAQIKALLNNTASYRGIQLYIYSRVANPSFVFQVGTAGAGTAGANALPTQVAGMIHLATAFAGRGYRGRLYEPFPATASADVNGLPAAGYLAALLAHKNTLIANAVLVGAGGTALFQPEIFHRAHGVIPRSWTPITAGSIPTKFGTQRRRGSYGRINASPI